jgi:hypothetical protein
MKYHYSPLKIDGNKISLTEEWYRDQINTMVHGAMQLCEEKVLASLSDAFLLEAQARIENEISRRMR